MLSKNTFLEARIQSLLDGSIYVGKRFSVHVQCMLKLSRVYTLAEILSKIFVKKKKENCRPYLRFGTTLIFIKIIYYATIACTTYKRICKLSKIGLFSVFLYTFSINCVTTGVQKMPIEYCICFALFIANNA